MNFKHFLAITGVALAFALSGTDLKAQGGFGGGAGGGMGGGNFDPTQFMQTQVDNLRAPLGVTNDADWSAISPLVLNVVMLKAQDATAGLGALFRGGRGGGRGGGGGRMAGLFGAQTDPAGDALQQALDNNASAAELKAAMTKVREARDRKKVALAKAQAALKDVLTTRQEAVLLSYDLLD